VAESKKTPICFPQEPLNPTRAVLAQFFGHLPTVLAFDWGQQTLQEATRPASCLGSTKVPPNAAWTRANSAAARWSNSSSVFAPLPCSSHGSLLLLLEAVYSISLLTVTVVLSEAEYTVSGSYAKTPIRTNLRTQGPIRRAALQELGGIGMFLALVQLTP
jgi:hypothetical protein